MRSSPAIPFQSSVFSVFNKEPNIQSLQSRIKSPQPEIWSLKASVVPVLGQIRTGTQSPGLDLKSPVQDLPVLVLVLVDVEKLAAVLDSGFGSQR